jgi:nuclear pore complex protein Nup160
VLQEDAISEQLFQSSDSALDDLVWTADSMFSSLKVTVFPHPAHICSSVKYVI